MSDEMVGQSDSFMQGYKAAVHEIRLRTIALEVELSMKYPGAENKMIRSAIKDIFASVHNMIVGELKNA